MLRLFKKKSLGGFKSEIFLLETRMAEAWRRSQRQTDARGHSLCMRL